MQPTGSAQVLAMSSLVQLQQEAVGVEDLRGGTQIHRNSDWANDHTIPGHFIKNAKG